MTQEAFLNRFGQGLNPRQKEAVCTADGRNLLLAVPGSGKTTVLVTRLGYMVCCCGIPPENILTVTFTTAAAKEMEERFAGMFPDIDTGNMTFCTINSLCCRIIRYVSRQSGRPPFEMLKEGEGLQLLRQIYEKVNEEFASETTVKDVQRNITYIKNMNLTDQQIKQGNFDIPGIAEIFEEYCRTLREQRRMDFDDQLVYAYNLLKKMPFLLKHFQDRYPYICVDEAQDTSLIQHELIRMLSETHGNLFMVGDEDQSIYGFRGAYPVALLNFRNRFPEAKILTMEENYRSCQPITQLASCFIAGNTLRYPKDICPIRKGGEPVEIIPVSSRDGQYCYLLDKLCKCSEETAILYRNNDSALPLIDLMERHHIPYCFTKKDIGFFTHRMVLDFLDFIQFAFRPCDTELFMSLYYKAGLRLNKQYAAYVCDRCRRTNRSVLDILTTDRELPSYARENAQTFSDVMARVPGGKPYRVLEEIWNLLDYKSYASQRKMDEGKYSILRILARQTQTCQELTTRLQELEQIIRDHKNQDSSIILSTIHSSKGLEFDSVYLLDILDGILPEERDGEVQDPMQHEEDRRVCYVGITRAKNKLHFFECKGCKSQYLAETKRILSGKPLKIGEKNQIKSQLQQPVQPECLQIQAEQGMYILHKVFGPGVIQKIQGDLVTVWMEEKGRIMVFSWKKILERRLLQLGQGNQKTGNVFHANP